MKRPSEAEFGKALRDVDLRLYVYRPPDPKGGEGVSNWKPCDFMAWHREYDATISTWFEVKDNPQVATFPLADLRPAQIAGIEDAHRLGIPYWLAIWWRRPRRWTISDAWRVLAWFRGSDDEPPTSIPLALLETRFGVDSGKNQLSSTLKNILIGDV